MTQLTHPMQPIVIDDGGIIRFKDNAIVGFLLDFASARGMDMNMIATMRFSVDDRVQFAQLIGHSVSGFGDLDYVPKKIVAAADKAADKLRFKSS